MSVCWPGATSNHLHQSDRYPTLPMIASNQNDQQRVHQFHSCNFISFAQHFSALSFNTNSTPSISSLSWPPTLTKKKPTSVPQNMKDNNLTKTLFLFHLFQTYREHRMKNNESARKSRELRRQKEESTQLRCDQLLQENYFLRTELSLLRSEIEQLRQIISISSNNSQQNFIPGNSVPSL
ncbi:D site-binding protein [Dirofilaria immitis]